MNKRFGFTLAEVLITLGIIGVVAALTIPNLISNTNGAKFRAQFKKAVSTLNQAGLLAQSQYNYDFGGTIEKCGAVDKSTGEQKDKANKKRSFCALLNGTLSGATYFDKVSGLTTKVSGAKESYGLKTVYTLDKNKAKNYHAYVLADGSIVAFPSDAKSCYLPESEQLSKAWLETNPQCIGFIDANGPTLPNTEVSCVGESGANVATQTINMPCEVSNDSNHLTDVYPIVFHDSTVEPASDAAKYVLTTEK